MKVNQFSICHFSRLTQQHSSTAAISTGGNFTQALTTILPMHTQITEIRSICWKSKIFISIMPFVAIIGMIYIAIIMIHCIVSNWERIAMKTCHIPAIRHTQYINIMINLILYSCICYACWSAKMASNGCVDTPVRIPGVCAHMKVFDFD